MAFDSWAGNALLLTTQSADTLVSVLHDAGWRVDHVSTLGEALAHLDDAAVDVVFCAAVPDGPGLADITNAISSIDLDAAVVWLTDEGQETSLQDAIHAGASDHLPWVRAAAEISTVAVRAAAHRRRLLDVRGRVERQAAAQSPLAERNRQLTEDLTRVQLERDDALKRAAESDQAKSSFLANMSHELRTPLNAILGYAELLSEDAEATGSPTLRDLRRIHGAGRHLLSLISDVLELARIDGNTADLYYEATTLSAVVRSAGVALSRTLERSGNRLSIGKLPDVAMVTDVAKIGSILERLLHNADKFTEGGRLGLSARVETAPIAMAVITVSDNGIGMSATQSRAIFREFSQGDTSTTRRYGGTGLGLSIALRLARKLGGDIQVVSEQGVGSTFTVHIPLEPPMWEGPTANQLMGPPVADEPPTVLVVDADPTLQRQMSAYLGRAGYRVVSTSSGAEALRLARSLHPDLISLDVVLPDMDGWSLLRELKTSPDTADIPVALVTLDDDRVRGLTVGAADYLSKPVQRDALLKMVRRLNSDRSGTVLIVEDDEPTRDVATRMLSAEGWTTAAVGNGREALDWLGSNPPPALMLLDLMMPEVDGFHVITELQCNEDWREIPVVVFTAMDVPPARMRFLERHVASVIRKGGVGHEEMLEQVRALIERTLRR